MYWAMPMPWETAGSSAGRCRRLDNYYMWQVANGIRVIFDKNGGATEASPRIMSQEKVAGSANHFDLPTTNPTRTGYLFNGWNTKADGAGAVFTAETDVTDNMTVYAQWKPDEAYAVKIALMNPRFMSAVTAITA
ncbi:MAG: InlB B-repeat-containing protein [Butyricicoccus sp.]